MEANGQAKLLSRQSICLLGYATLPVIRMTYPHNARVRIESVSYARVKHLVMGVNCPLKLRNMVSNRDLGVDSEDVVCARA